jgi:hypothetical protein
MGIMTISTRRFVRYVDCSPAEGTQIEQRCFRRARTAACPSFVYSGTIQTLIWGRLTHANRLLAGCVPLR